MTADLSVYERFVVGAIALVLAVALGTLGVSRAVGVGSDEVRMVAVFDDAVGQGLDTFSDVRVRGVRVGMVDAIDLGEDGRVRVTLRLDPDLQLPRSTQVSVQPLSIFGPKSIELDLGGDAASGPFLAAGDTLMVAEGPTELSELVASATRLLESVDAEGVRTVLRTLADGLDGRGGDIAAGIDAADELTTLFDDRDDDTARMLDDVATLTDVLGDRGPDIVATARGFEQSLPVFSEQADRIAVLLDDVTRVSGDVASLLDQRRREIGPIVAGLTRTAAVLDRRLAEVPDLLQVFDEFFRLVADIAVLPRPDGSTQVGIDAIVSTDLCRALQPCQQLPEPLQQLLDLDTLLDALGLDRLLALLSGGRS